MLSRSLFLKFLCASALTLLSVAAAQSASGPVGDAIALLQAGKRAEAVTLLQSALTKDPTLAPAAHLLSQVLLNEHRLPEAAEVIAKALAVNPGSADLLQARGDIEFRQADFGAAEKSYKQSLRIDKNNARALYGIARVFHSAALGKFSATLFRQAHELAPDDGAITSGFARYAATDAERQAIFETFLKSPAGASGRSVQSVTARTALAKYLNGRDTGTLATPYAASTIHMQVLLNGRHANGLALQVAVNGAKTAVLELDTGASGITITRRLAEKAQVERIAEMSLTGIGDERDPSGYVGFAERIRIGGVEFRDCVVHVSDKAFSADADGLVGTDIFQRFLITLDFRNRQLRLDPLPGPPWDGHEPVDRYLGPELQGYSQVFRFGHQLLIKTQTGDAQAGFFLLDTGSAMNVMSNSAARGVARVRGEDRMTITGVSGRVRKVESADEVTVMFAGYRQKLLDLAAINLDGISHSAGTEVSGILGLPTLILFDFTIDYRDGMVKFVFNPPLGM